MPIEPSPAAQLIRNRWNELADQAPFQWVAATAEEIVSQNPILGEVIQEVADRGLTGQVAFAFINVGRLPSTGPGPFTSPGIVPPPIGPVAPRTPRPNAPAFYVPEDPDYA